MGDALRVSALLLLDFLVSAGEASSLAQHAGILNSLQQALGAEELKARAAAVIAHLCQHPGAVEFVRCACVERPFCSIDDGAS